MGNESVTRESCFGRKDGPIGFMVGLDAPPISEQLAAEFPGVDFSGLDWIQETACRLFDAGFLDGKEFEQTCWAIIDSVPILLNAYEIEHWMETGPTGSGDMALEVNGEPGPPSKEKTADA